MAEFNKELINLVKRQTNYSEELVLEKLKQYKNDVETIILEYNGVVQTQNENNVITTNQKIFKAIRDNMNEISTKNKSKK